MSLNNKIRWILGLGLVFVLIISTNLLDKKNYGQLRDSTIAVYEDRLLADNLIYKLLQKTHEKELGIVSNSENYFSTKNANLNKRIEELMVEFSKTEMTAKERIVFNALKENSTKLVAIERSFLSTENTDKTEILNSIADIRENLSSLSELHLKEGALQMQKSEQALKTIELFSDIEIYIIIFIALVVLFIILYKPKDEEVTSVFDQ